MRDASRLTIGSPGALVGKLSHLRSVQRASQKKMAPTWGPWVDPCAVGIRQPAPDWKCLFYRPKRGRSPLRFEISALAIRRPSIAATRRAKSEEEGASAAEAVFDIGNPFLETVSLAVSSKGQFMYTRCQYPHSCLHGSMRHLALQHKCWVGRGVSDIKLPARGWRYGFFCAPSIGEHGRTNDTAPVARRASAALQQADLA